MKIIWLKPLKNLQVMLETPNKEDRKLSTALFELFFYAEKLAIKWSIQHEYRARLKDREEIIEKLSETSHFLNMIISDRLKLMKHTCLNTSKNLI